MTSDPSDNGRPNQQGDAPVTSPGPSLTPGPALTVEGAALAGGRHSATLQNALERGEFPNAYRDPADGLTWLIPVADLQAAGYELRDV